MILCAEDICKHWARILKLSLLVCVMMTESRPKYDHLPDSPLDELKILSTGE